MKKQLTFVQKVSPKSFAKEVPHITVLMAFSKLHLAYLRYPKIGQNAVSVMNGKEISCCNSLKGINYDIGKEPNMELLKGEEICPCKS